MTKLSIHEYPWKTTDANELLRERDRLLGWAEDAVHLLETCPVPNAQWAAASDALRAEHRRALLDETKEKKEC